MPWSGLHIEIDQLFSIDSPVYFPESAITLSNVVNITPETLTIDSMETVNEGRVVLSLSLAMTPFYPGNVPDFQLHDFWSGRLKSVLNQVKEWTFPLFQLTVYVCHYFQSQTYSIMLKGLAMIFAGQENAFIIFRSKEIYYIFQNK